LPTEVGSQVFYLHGAVHIIQHAHLRLPDRATTKMLRYDLGRALMQQVDKRIAEGELPVFVAEGTSDRKQGAIGRLSYLRDVHQQFGAALRNTQDALFTFGHSFGESDNHIAKHIADGTIMDVYIGTFLEKDERRAAELALLWNEARRSRGRPQVRVHCFDPSGCSVWTRYDTVAA
jgi:hypothetical protein